jgi:phage terminase small subunit
VSRKTHNPRPLSPRAKLYIAEYLRSLNGAKAAVAAGYSKAAAVDISKQLQNNPLVREAVNQGIAEREQEIRDKAVKAMEHCFCQATADIGDLCRENGEYLPVHEMPRRVRRAIQSIEFETRYERIGDATERYTVTKVRLHDKRASQELLVKYAGKLKERLEIDATMNYAEMVLAAQRKREEDGKQESTTEEPAKP